MLPKLTLPQNVREDARPVLSAVMVLEAALDMHRDGTLNSLLVERPGAKRWLTRIFLQTILGAAGDALPPDPAMTVALTWLMEWAITQLRPDRAPTLQIDDRNAWLDSTSWRPAIAVMCHYGFATVPDFKDRYYRRPDETPADNLCGLWNIGPSTYYRYLEKAKRLMARVLYEQRLDGRHATSLRTYAQHGTYLLLGLTSDAQRKSWHQRQVSRCLNAADYLSALWHADKAGDSPALHNIIRQHMTSLVQNIEFQTLLTALAKQASDTQDRVFFLLAQSEEQRLLSQPANELGSLEEALRIAAAESDSLLLGVVYSHLGKYHESRDAIKALTYYQESLTFLGKLRLEDQHSIVFSLPDAYVETVAKLAWLYMLKNDPRAEGILSEQHIGTFMANATDTTRAMLEQVWGEFYRRNGSFEKALEHRFKALAIYERLNNADGMAKTLLNIGLVYIDMGQFDQALVKLEEAMAKAGHFTAHSEFLASAHLNMGVCYYWKKLLDAAEREYKIVLKTSSQAGLKIWQARAHHNLTEVHYQRFVQTSDHSEEEQGNKHAGLAMALYTDLGIYHYVDIVRNLKTEMLTNRPTQNTADRLLPQEMAANYPEISEIDVLRRELQTITYAEDIVKAHLKIAEIYLQLSIRERDEAKSLARTHNFYDLIQPDLEHLAALFHQDTFRNRSLKILWHEQANNVIDEEKQRLVIDCLLASGYINKSKLADVCNVSLATASKYLSILTEGGLLVQEGKGPATKYRLKI